jgi:hypothetical protein
MLSVQAKTLLHAVQGLFPGITGHLRVHQFHHDAFTQGGIRHLYTGQVQAIHHATQDGQARRKDLGTIGDQRKQLVPVHVLTLEELFFQGIQRCRGDGVFLEQPELFQYVFHHPHRTRGSIDHLGIAHPGLQMVDLTLGGQSCLQEPMPADGLLGWEEALAEAHAAHWNAVLPVGFLARTAGQFRAASTDIKNYHVLAVNALPPGNASIEKSGLLLAGNDLDGYTENLSCLVQEIIETLGFPKGLGAHCPDALARHGTEPCVKAGEARQGLLGDG